MNGLLVDRSQYADTDIKHTVNSLTVTGLSVNHSRLFKAVCHRLYCRCHLSADSFSKK